MQGTQVQSQVQEDLLEEEIATCSSILAWEIPWTEEPGRLQCTGPQELDMIKAHAHKVVELRDRG